MLLAIILLSTLVTVESRIGDDVLCKQQLDEFLACKHNVYNWKENADRQKDKDLQYRTCLENNHCAVSVDDLPEDGIAQRTSRCWKDVDQAVLDKVVSCVRRRVSPTFQLPSKYRYEYGRYSDEITPTDRQHLQHMCENGDYDGVLKCFAGVRNRIAETVEETKAMYEKACQRRAECYKKLDDRCTAQFDELREGWCECAYQVHETYGGPRLVSSTPSCAGLTSNSSRPTGALRRESCEPKELDEREVLYLVCTYSYEYMKNWLNQRFGITNTTAAPTTRAIEKRARKGKKD